MKRLPEKPVTRSGEHFVVEQVRSEDIGPPSDRFLAFVKKTPELNFIHGFTLPAFKNQVKRSFVSAKVDDPPSP